MKDRVFFDTNIVIYLYSEDEPDKQNIILDLLSKYFIIISTQVINELSNILFKKMKFGWNDIKDVAEELTQNLEVIIIDINIIKSAYYIKIDLLQIKFIHNTTSKYYFLYSC